MFSVNYCCGNGKAFADRERFGLEGEKLLEFVEKQQKIEEERRREEEEKEEKRRQLEEEKEERRRILEGDRRKEEEEKEERRRREGEVRETRWQERDLRKLELEADLLRQNEAIEAAKREHESIKDVAPGPNLTDEQQTVFTDLAKHFLRICLLKHQVKHILFSITLNSLQTNRLDQDLTQYPYSMRESLRKDIADMIKMGVIRESSSPYASPVVVAKKKDNTNRLCQLLNICSKSLVETNSFQKLTLARDIGK